MDGLVQGRQDGSFKVAVQRRHGAQRAGHAKDVVEVGLAAGAKLAGRLAKRLHITADQLAIEVIALAAAPLHAERDLHMAARQPFFQHTADLHLQLIHLHRQTELRVEKTVIDRLQRECE